MDGLNKAGVEIDRKVLAQMALDEPKAFEQLATLARSTAGAA